MTGARRVRARGSGPGSAARTVARVTPPVPGVYGSPIWPMHVIDADTNQQVLMTNHRKNPPGPAPNDPLCRNRIWGRHAGTPRPTPTTRPPQDRNPARHRPDTCGTRRLSVPRARSFCPAEHADRHGGRTRGPVTARHQPRQRRPGHRMRRRPARTPQTGHPCPGRHRCRPRRPPPSFDAPARPLAPGGRLVVIGLGKDRSAPHPQGSPGRSTRHGAAPRRQGRCGDARRGPGHATGLDRAGARSQRRATGSPGWRDQVQPSGAGE